MKVLNLILVLFLVSFSAIAQKDKVLFTINNEAVKVSEFKNIYEKNIDLVDEKAKDIDKNLELYINYKLKVSEAYNLKLDTLISYKRELKKYKQQLIAPYLQDEDFRKKQIRDSYDRTKEEIRASHILLLFPKKGKKDTLAMITKLEAIRNRIEQGESFAKVAKEVSEDPSARQNGGDLGFFSAFKMVYPFEEAAYTTSKGEVSKPFKTRFGYHIVKVTDKRLSKGEFEAAHILIKGASSTAKVKINEAYENLEKGISFEEIAKKVSGDKGSAVNGGRLNKFKTGVMVAPFENAVLAIDKEGDYSKPFKTRFGWHIVKLIKKYPIGSFEELEPALTKKVMSGSRGGLSKKAVINRLKKEYTINTREKELNLVLEGTALDDTTILATINNVALTVMDYKTFQKSKKRRKSEKGYDNFIDTEVLNYFKKDLENNNKALKATLKEYKDGLLLFDLMQNKIWKKSSTDSLGLQDFFKENKKNYKAESLDLIKGKVVNDYQMYLEDTWIQELRKNNVVIVKKKVLKKLKKYYNQ